MTIEELEKIFEEDSDDWEGDNAYKGLQILSKYTSDLISGADHDVIYSCGIDVLIEKGITKEDAEALRKLNWMVRDGEYMACFV